MSMNNHRLSSRERENQDLSRFGQHLLETRVDLTLLAERLEVLALAMGLDPIPPYASKDKDPNLLLALQDGRRVVIVDTLFSAGCKVIVKDPEED